MEELSGEGGGEIVPNVGNVGLQPTLIPGFLSDQVNGLMTMMLVILDAKLEARSGHFNQ